MASVWKHFKSANWFARYRGANGKTVNRSTGVTEREEAINIAGQWEIEATRDRAKNKGDVSPGGISDTIAKAERLARQGRLDGPMARELINGLLTASGSQTLDAVTNRVWCEGWKTNKEGTVGQKAKWKYAQVVRDWLAFLKAKADKPLELVSKSEAVSFRDRLGADGLSGRTVNQTMKILRGIYQDAVEQGHLGRNPFLGVDPLRDDNEDAKREPFTREEVAGLIKVAEGDWQGLIILAATTGLRLMDAARLQWRALDLDARIIRTKTAKTGAKLTLPIHGDFAEWLANQRAGIGGAPVFPKLADKAGSGKSGLSVSFKRLMARAEIAPGIARHASKEGRGRSTSKKSFHSLRHFAASQLAEAGVRGEIARAITGHSDAETHAGYVTPDIDALRKAVGNIRLSA